MAEFDLDRDALPEEGTGGAEAATAQDGADDAAAGTVQDGSAAPETEQDRVIREASSWKETGNGHYKAKEYEQAIDCYTEAIRVLPPREVPHQAPGDAGAERGEAALLDEEGSERAGAAAGSDREEEDEFADAVAHHTEEPEPGQIASGPTEGRDLPVGAAEVAPSPGSKENDAPAEEHDQAKPPAIQIQDDYAEMRSVFYCNRAACLQQLGRNDEALADCATAIECVPTYVKAYMRRAQTLEKMEKYQDAINDLNEVIKLEPGSTLAKQRKVKLERLEHERIEKLKTETFGKLKDLGNSILGNFGLSTDNFKFEQDPNTGSYSMQFVQNPTGE